MNLNQEQRKAVEHREGPLLVIAGAGSGKTRIVAERIVKLLSSGIDPSSILALTFTNKAAKEMKDRINSNVLTCTFHSLGARILRESIDVLGYEKNFLIYDEEDSFKVLKSFINEGDFSSLKEVKERISKIKNDLLETSDELFLYYQSLLKKYNAVDFDDLLYLPIKILQNEDIRKFYQNKWNFLLVDEYQDTNFAQYMLIKILSENHKNIFAVGDPDQSIYSWRGARYQNILNFEQDFPNSKVITLEHNYRSTNTILSAANSLIKHNFNRPAKNLWSTLEEGEKISLFSGDNEKEEAKFILNRVLVHREKMALNEMAIFYRTNAQSRVFEDVFLKSKIPYIIYGGLSFYERKEIKDIVAFLRQLASPSDFVSFERIVNIPKRGIGKATLEKLKNKLPLKLSELSLPSKQLATLNSYIQLMSSLNPHNKISKLIIEIVDKTGYLDYLKEDKESFEDRKANINELIAKAIEWEDETENNSLENFLEELALISPLDKKEEKNSIKLMTLHNSKGLEFELVFMTGMEEDLFPHINSKDNPEDIEEERRLCYVGMTRAKKKLYITSSRNRYLWNFNKTMRPSRFLKEIEKQYTSYFSNSLEVSEDFEEGDLILHPIFGKGQILKTNNLSFGKTYEVQFEHATKTLVAKYAKMEKIN